MTILQIAILAIVQGLAELLPVSSSAHVILAQKLMGLDPSAPEMTFLLVMLHTGTMFAVLAYFARRWKRLLETNARGMIRGVVLATALTGVLGLGLKKLIEVVILEGMLGHPHGEVEHLFKVLPLVATALAAAGFLILVAARKDTPEHLPGEDASYAKAVVTDRQSVIMGLLQGLALPFRGFSRSGVTISAGLLSGMPRQLAEEFSFALAVVLTPPVIVQQLHRLTKANAAAANPLHLSDLLTPGLIGMVFAFGAGLVALKWLSAWLESGKWKYFGIYCLVFSGVVWGMWAAGF